MHRQECEKRFRRLKRWVYVTWEDGVVMKALMCLIAASFGLAILPCKAIAQGTEREDTPRMVLVELFTSQGCDMCPEAERLLGVLAARNSRVVPIAFHVDYFNKPWKDPFSDKLYSERQAAYNTLYTKPKNPEYGLYYTPMLMVDGLLSVNGRDPEGIQAAVRQAQTRKPQVALEAELMFKDDQRAGDLRISPRGPVAADQRAGVAGLCGSPGRPRRHSGRLRGECQQDLDGAIPSAIDSIRVHQPGRNKGGKPAICLPCRARLEGRESRSGGVRPGPQVRRDLSVDSDPLGSPTTP